MNNKQLIIDIDSRLKNSIKDLADEFDVSLKELVKKALIDLLKKHGKSIPIEEL